MSQTKDSTPGLDQQATECDAQAEAAGTEYESLRKSLREYQRTRDRDALNATLAACASHSAKLPPLDFAIQHHRAEARRLRLEAERLGPPCGAPQRN